MNIFFPKEHNNETRFSLTGETAEKFLKKDINLYIEKTIQVQDTKLKTLSKINLLRRWKETRVWIPQILSAV